MSMTLDERFESVVAGFDVSDNVDELQKIHMENVAKLFDAQPGMPRVIAAQEYIRLLSQMAREARALRNVEVLRAKANGVGPSEMGRSFDRSKARGYQVINEAEKDDEAQAIVNRLRRTLVAWRRGGKTGTNLDRKP